MSTMVNDRKVMLFSGGLDSFCMYKIINPDIIITFDIGTEDNKKELSNINRMIQQDVIDKNKIKIIKLDLSLFELSNKIIPHRNTIMTLLASTYGNQIYIGTTLGDSTRDKDYVFKSQVEGILNYFALDSNKVAHSRYPYSVEMPFKGLTKTQIVRWYLKQGYEPSELLKYSRSCYNGHDKECGICRSCVRKMVALILNDIEYTDYFERDPFQDETLLDTRIINKMKDRSSEWDDFKKALEIT